MIAAHTNPDADAPSIPASPDALTAAWVSAAMVAGGRPNARVAAVERERIGEGVGVLAELYRLHLAYGPGAAGPASLIAKLGSSSPEVREVCAAYGMYEREVRFYQEVAGEIDLRTPEPYFAAYDAALGDFVILMEDLASATSPDQVAGISLADLTAAIDGIATLHARWWDRPRLAELRVIMPSLAEPPYGPHGAENYRACLPTAVEGLNARGHHDLARIAERVGAVIETLLAAMAAEPLTLAHGDFRVDNLMFRGAPAGRELTVIDWQVAMQVRGPFDVGYLMGGAAPTELRRAHEAALLRRYHDALIGQGVTGYSFETCLLDYRRAMLFSLVYWVEGFPVADFGTPRVTALFDSWADRLAAAAEDLSLEALVAG